MRRIGIHERRARLAVRHHVAPTERVSSVIDAARDVVCLHATDPATVYLSAWARMVDLGEQPGLVLPDDLEATDAPAPWVALLPPLDPTTMGWQARDWYLGAHKTAIFDSTGNAGPTIWSDGRIVGGWAIRSSGEVVTRLLEDVGREAAVAIDAEAERLTAWLQSVPVVPRFPTPLQKELVG